MLIEYLYRNTEIYLLYSRLFSTSIATILSFGAAMITFPFYINYLRKLNFSSELEPEKNGKGEPVMPAGILFLIIIIAVSLLTARFNSYVISTLIIYSFFSIIGAVDDIAKIVNKRRLAKGLITKQDYQYKSDGISASLRLTLYILISGGVAILAYKYIPNINGHITIPFLSVEKIFPYLPAWLFVPFMTLVVAVLANGVNFTDGVDTLATVPLITCYIFVVIISYIASNSVWAEYLLIPHITGVEEILPIGGAVFGVLLAFLWFNSPPSTIIMGDSGSIGLGGMVAIMFVFIKAEFYLPIVGFIFMMEFVSDIIQIFWFKTTGKRFFLMAPIHHHFQLKMIKDPFYCNNKFFVNSKIRWRFHILSVILLIVGLILFLKVR
ncbi:MAG: phospho-N-acetylmuramoyl-pentapeptide-transferase [Chitinivibrionales bacterium]|nr:phospho-N-acetylmuramoyl-pentapeptide-transferase [Chitinivibrionales bacterium]